VRVFQYSRPFRKDTGKKEKDDNEFANLWIAKTFSVVAETFPNVQRRLEVVERRCVEFGCVLKNQSDHCEQ
jgi:hypothetical protein